MTDDVERGGRPQNDNTPMAWADKDQSVELLSNPKKTDPNL